MKKGIAVLGIAGTVLLSGSLLAEEWKNVSLVDTMCSEKDAVKADPDKHPAKCAVACAKSGYGIMADGKFLKFDEAGNARTLSSLKKLTKDKDLKAKVTGTVSGDVLQVESIEFPK